MGFEITDNGIGFNEANMKSFLTLDSEYKAKKGGRGVGRLLWLKAFERVSVTSVFKSESGEAKSRSFLFNASAGVTDNKPKQVPRSSENPTTTVRLEGFGKRYQKASCKTVQPIANSLFEHCLWYFVRPGSVPKIVVEDDGDTIALDEVYQEYMVSSAVTDTISFKDNEFSLIHIKLRTNSSHSHAIALCAANRLVKEEKLIGKIPGLYGKLKDDAGEFFYMCYVGSRFLDNNVRAERTEFDISEDTGGLFAETGISLNDIRSAVIANASEHLSEYLTENKKKSAERVDAFVAQKAPRYRPILSRIPDANLWLIDERLAFHDYLASDKPLSSMPITGSMESKEPDICCLKVLDNPILITEREQPPFASLTIIEIKRSFVLVPALCAARPGYALRAALLHLQAAGCQTARSAECRVPRGAPEPEKPGGQDSHAGRNAP
ncbi:MAG: hypothetical protein GY862_22845 [Gammaproteobacteria bacterium]|nr:hypothetical protein [Gammaproteobacteria bacterium]